MKGKLIAMSFCAMFVLALVTVHLKTRETLLRYEIAELEMHEDLLSERIFYLESELEGRAGVVGLLNKAVELGISLNLGGLKGPEIPLLVPVEDQAAFD